jgi:hypothetical protein
MKMTKKIAAICLLISTAGAVHAQKKIAEGTVIYTVDYELPADKQQFASMLPKEVTCYFRGDSTASVMNQGPATIKGVSDYKANYQGLLIDVPAASKKISVVLTPSEIEEMESTIPKLNGVKGSEKQTIAGYNCTKVVATDAKTNTTYDIWVTNDIDIIPNSLTHSVSTFGGVPVKFVAFSQGIKINAVLKEVKETTVPKGFFTATKDYESMSYEDLKAMSGGN